MSVAPQLGVARSVDVSVVIPHVDRTQTLSETIERLDVALRERGDVHEVLVVFDGGTDEAWARLLDVVRRRPEVHAVRLDRRSWALNARAVGTILARGRSVVWIDDDLDIDPEEALRLLDAIDAGADLAAAVRSSRDGRAAPRRVGSIAIRALSSTVRGRPRDVSCGLKAFSRDHARRVVDAWPGTRDIRLGLRSYQLANRLTEVEVVRNHVRAGSNHRPRTLAANMVDTSLTLVNPGRWIDVRWLTLAAVATRLWRSRRRPGVGVRLVGHGVEFLALLAVLDVALGRRSPVPRSVVRTDGKDSEILRRDGSQFRRPVPDSPGAGLR